MRVSHPCLTCHLSDIVLDNAYILPLLTGSFAKGLTSGILGAT